MKVQDAVSALEQANAHEKRLQELEDKAATARHYHQAHCRREASSGVRDHETRQRLHDERLQAESDLRAAQQVSAQLNVKAAERDLLAVAKAGVSGGKREDVYKIADGLASADPKARVVARARLVKVVSAKSGADPA